MKNIYLFEKAHSRWLILLIDQLIVVWALSMSFLIANKADFSAFFTLGYLRYTGLFTAVSVAVFTLKRIHTGMIRYSNTEDMRRIFSATLVCNVIYLTLGVFFHRANIPFVGFRLSETLILNFFISSGLLVMLRLGVKNIFNLLRMDNTEVIRPVVIYGSGKAAVLVKHALENHPQIRYDIVGFIDADDDKIGKQIEQKRVYSFYSLRTLKGKNALAEMLVVNSGLNNKGPRQAMEECIRLGIKVLTVPPAEQWFNGQLKQSQIKDLKIEDLLQREPIVLKKKNILEAISGKRVLVTGAAGSIGSEIVRQVLGYNPEKIILVDQAETPTHELQLELEDKGLIGKVKICLASIQNYQAMQAVFKAHRPEIVFHAAAYKHVPLMENNPFEAVRINVQGTKNLADIAVDLGVEKFIMISTDKAVNPTNVMGASKRLAEIYIQSLNKMYSEATVMSHFMENNDLLEYARDGHCTKFITTRFGNVLGSNGSVIPRFKAQIERGGPVTVTHPEITRYFMTIPEAVQLVLEAGAMGHGGEIYVFDMGQPVRIADLAKNMIKLSGLVPDIDIKVEYTGLRPGEKLYEELLNKDEQTIPTHHPKIKISRVIEYPFNYVQESMNALLEISEHASETEVVRKMKEIVPEYKSNNSRFEVLDNAVEALS